MPKDSLYFKHDSNASEDRKCKALRRRWGWEGQGWFWKIIETLRDAEQHKLPYDDITLEGFADDFEVDIEKVKSFIDDCIERTNLFISNNGHIHSNRLDNDMAHMAKVKEKRSLAGQKSGERRKELSQDPDKFVKGPYSNVVNR